MTESKFYAAFRAAQSEFRDPVKDATNPHFKSRFVSLKGVLDAVRPALHKHGLSLFQAMEGASVRTEIRHDDGSGIASTCPIICAKQNDPQAYGSALTYARRYAIAALCGIAPADEDDDGEEATDRPVSLGKPAKPPEKKPEAKAFDLAEEAVAAILSCQTKDDLNKIMPRLVASKINNTLQGEDYAIVKQALEDRKKELN